MSLIETLHQPLAWQSGSPLSSALFRASPNDFLVSEQLGFEPDGQGEHVFLRIQKTGENTDWVVQQLSRFSKTHPRDIGYAGKKDRHAVTEQWFSVKFPIKSTIDWSAFETPSLKVLQACRHSRKLKTGVHQGNRFVIRLRQVSDANDLKARFESVMQKGVPNYFGEQRFGHHYGNLYKGYQLIQNQLRENNRQKRGLYISALRSMLFNRVVSARLEQSLWDKLMLGDVLMLNDSQSCFSVNETSEMTELYQRLNAGQVHVTAPLWGRGGLMTRFAAESFEQQALVNWTELCQGLETLGLNQERRAVRVIPKNASIEQEAEEQWLVRFDLPAGSFATSVLREIAHLHTEDAVEGI